MIDMENIPLDDKKTWDMICEGRVKGCFQIESHLGKTWCKEAKPRSILELSDVISIIRPGCVSGDTLIRIKETHVRDTKYASRVAIREIYKNKSEYKTITSIDEADGSLLDNEIVGVTYSGEKECFKVKVARYGRRYKQNNVSSKSYNLECTSDHKLLTPDGWKELKDIKINERIAILKKDMSLKRIKNESVSRFHPGVYVKNARNSKYFHEICYQAYKQECVMCDWNSGSLDVNHLEGNRYTDNSPGNLCFMCPNHHRMYTEGSLSKETVVASRKDKKLPPLKRAIWATFLGAESVGVKDTYDISMKAPHHNFIAGNFVVHNCLQFVYDGKSMTKHYCDRKSKKDQAKPLHPILEDILKDTHQIIIYQESIMKIASVVAGFDEKSVNSLRKNISKKNAKELFALEEKFIDGCVKTSNLKQEEAKLIFDNIKASARYLFCKSHGVGYALQSYWSAYLKLHYVKKYYKHWLRGADEKIDPDMEKRQLIMSARAEGINIKGPHYSQLEEDFFWDGNAVCFGICNIKGIGKAHLTELREQFNVLETEDWPNILFRITPNVSKTAIENMIMCGAFSGLGKTRTEMLHEYKCISDLTDKEIQAIVSTINLNSEVKDIMSTFLSRGTKKNGGLISTDSRLKKVKDILSRLENPGRSMIDNPSIYAKAEEKLIAYPINISELSGCSEAAHANATCKEIEDGRMGHSTLAVIVTKFREHKTKKDETMCFLSAEDESGEIENIVIFPDVYSQFKDIIYEKATILISGEVKDKERKSFIVERIFQI